MVDNWFPKEHMKHFGVACGPFNVSYKNGACKMRARVLKRSGLITLLFVCEKGLVDMYQNHHFIYFPILYFAHNGVSGGDRLRLTFMDFERHASAN